MPTFSKPIPITDAMTLNTVKAVLPSTLDSAAQSALARTISERAVFSARVSNTQFLADLQHTLTDLLSGETNRATARVQLQEALRQISYTPATEDAGTIKDLGSSGRLNLILDTNVATATGFGRDLQAQDPDVIDAFPAQELYRAIDVQEPRDWPTRWRTAAEIANDPKAMTAFGKDGRMIALKSSPIWAALGNTDNFSDALGNDYAPFAWNSGMRTRDIDRLEAQDLGLIAAGERIEPRRSPEDFNASLSASGNLPENLRSELLREFGDLVQFDGETLTLKSP